MKLCQEIIEEILSYGPDHAPQWMEVMEELEMYFIIKRKCDNLVIELITILIKEALEVYDSDNDDD